MTCIVGLVEDKKIWMGADSMVSSGNEYTILKSPKVFKNGSFLIGCAGTPRHAQLLSSSLFNPPQKKDKQTDIDYLITDLMEHIRTLFGSHGAIRQEDGKTDTHDSQYLIGYNGKLYAIEGNFQLIDSVNPYLAAGCGRVYAHAVLGFIDKNSKSFKKKISPQTKLSLALQAAEQNDPFVKAPFHFVSVKNNG